MGRNMNTRNGYLFNCESLVTEEALVSAAISLGAETVAGISAEEIHLAKSAKPLSKSFVSELRDLIVDGQDPLGEAFCQIRSTIKRRKQGATYTPQLIVDSMIEWAACFDLPERIVDPGAGSARFLRTAGRRFTKASLVGIEIDPLGALLARTNLAVAGYAKRSQILLKDYCQVDLSSFNKTLFIGNPPYVRHHQLEPWQKKWLSDSAAKSGYSASQLAGLHVYFFMATVANASQGDFGAFITAAEWLDVNYGSLVRELFLSRLGGQQIVVVEPTAQPFPDAASTAAITYFQIQSQPKTIRLKRVEKLEQLTESKGFRNVRRERFEATDRWSHLTRSRRKIPAGYIELGELCRVHRGQVTGFNKVWIAGSDSELPEQVLFPCVTKAQELFQAGKVLKNSTQLRRVIDLPLELDVFSSNERCCIDRFLAKAKALGTHLGYVASSRRAWWSVGLREPAPILTTYMARRPPAFVTNIAGARHINIAHGIYPREHMSKKVLSRLVEYLSNAVSVTCGRTYAGGLTKFEPREVERLLIPDLELLSAG